MSQRWRRLSIAGFIILAMLAALRLAPKAPLLDQVTWSQTISARDGTLLRVTLAEDEQYRIKTRLSELPPHFVNALLRYEDRYFAYHPGVNPIALMRAAIHTLMGDRRIGGSTITMQLARKIHGIDSRSIAGKVWQILAAFWIEMRYGKDEILEAYINIAPFGGNIEGVGAASLIYFKKPAERLSLPESVSLAVIPQNPARRLASSPDQLALNQARRLLWERLREDDGADPIEHEADREMPLMTFSRTKLPFSAPHLADMLIAQDRLLNDRPTSHAIKSTIDPRLQNLLERMVREYLRSRAASGIVNASALLVDSDTMEVRALVGSANYHDASIAGQVNGVLAKRSPGSTLKPFIFGLGLDQGILHPRTMLKDAPTAFGAFSPENFDGRFVGPVSAQDALIRSRNIPAVGVASKLSRPDLYDFLKLAGVTKMATRDHYGLALVLGGGEVTMEELARLYAMLANGGLLKPLKYRLDSEHEAAGGHTRLLSEEAAFIVLQMLGETPRPDSGVPARPAVAWKTGTSWGFRDAWTAGIFGRYVLIVWIGDFAGSSNPALIGVEAAAPLFLRIVDAIRAQGLDPGPVRRSLPRNLRRVDICQASGDIADGRCKVTSPTWFIAGRSPIKRSNLHRTVWVHNDTGEISCVPVQGAQARVVENWSSDVRRIYRDIGLPHRAVELPASCHQAAGEVAPSIVSPLRGVDYTVRTKKPEPIMLRSEATAGVASLYWFVNDSLVGRSNPGENLLWSPPAPGHYTVRVVDDRGQGDERQLVVVFRP